MRSLALKLTLAFLLVAVAGVVVFAVLVGGQTQDEFSRFLSARDQNVLVTALAEHYQSSNSWNGLQERIANSPQLTIYSRGATIADSNHIIIFGPPVELGRSLSDREMDDITPIESSRRTLATSTLRHPTNPAAHSDKTTGPRPTKAHSSGGWGKLRSSARAWQRAWPC